MMKNRFALVAATGLAAILLLGPIEPASARRPVTAPHASMQLLGLPMAQRLPIEALGPNRITVFVRGGSFRTISLSPSQMAALRAGQSILVTRGSSVQLMPAVDTVRGIVSFVHGNVLTLFVPGIGPRSFLIAQSAANTLARNQGITIAAKTMTAFTSPLRPSEITLFGMPGSGRLGTLAGSDGRLASILVAGRGLQTFALRLVHNATVRRGERVVIFTTGRTITRIVPAIQTARGRLATVSSATLILELPDGSRRMLHFNPALRLELMPIIGHDIVVSTTTAFATPLDRTQIERK